MSVHIPRPWHLLAFTVTWWAPSPVLKWLGWKSKDSRMAFREKIALVLAILLACAVFGFVTFGMSLVLCGPSAGKTKFTKYQPTKPIAKDHRNAYGHLVPVVKNTRYLPPSLEDCEELRQYLCRSCVPLNNMTSYAKIIFAWSDLEKDPFLFAFNGNVINATKLDLTRVSFNHSKIDKILSNPDIIDVTAPLAKTQDAIKVGNCLSTWFKVGEIAQFPFPCLISKAFTIGLLSILICLVVIKFLMALSYTWLMSLKTARMEEDTFEQSSAPIILFVTCFNEGQNSIKRTLNSLVCSNYDDQQKFIFIVCDGRIKSSEEKDGVLTCDIVRNMLRDDYESDPKWYYSIARGSKRVNRATIITGKYTHNNRFVNVIMVKKIGNGEQDSGNRGKRDSQLILMGWLQRVLFNELLSEMDYGLLRSIHNLTSLSIQSFDHVLMIDADTIIDGMAISKMMGVMERDKSVMGLCGETKIVNPNESWVTRIQVFEYFQSHHLGKAFESAFGGVTCLPGCFSMYRIKSQKGEYTYIPILASPEIIDAYSRIADPRSLHDRNLLDLGEDRYLTTLMMSTFPSRKLVYVKDAYCFTRVPRTFFRLLKQRRRWINSTVHNLWVLMKSREMCGIFCCSMQFVIFIEFLGTLMLPASMIFTGFLIYTTITDPYSAIAPLILLCLVMGLPSVLILLTSNLWMVWWMLLYLLALPIWNFIMPLYAFWHFDDFTWGKGGEESSAGGESVQNTQQQHLIERRQYSDWIRRDNQEPPRRFNKFPI
jgi:chitin synthase